MSCPFSACTDQLSWPLPPTDQLPWPFQIASAVLGFKFCHVMVDEHGVYNVRLRQFSRPAPLRSTAPLGPAPSAARRPWPAQALADVLNYGKNLPYAFGPDGGAGASNGPCYTTLDHFDAFLTSDDSPAPSDPDAVLLYLTAKPFAENLPEYNLDMTEFSFDDMVSAFPQPEPAKEKLLQVLAVNGWDSADTWDEDSVTQSRPWCARRSFFAR